ncbi:MAG: Eco57I restriction-modification methylase domain-containing protein [Chloroflexi bacterium]|nr:Eco57I restriction-modification methylase domain-containing protein [Chloroflexota bacterium]
MPVYAPARARVEIEKLVETFRANEAALHHAPEAQIENDFIRPLFRYLNWKVDNAGLARAQWEFVLQRTERGKRPDYELWLDGRRVLILDAKKVKYDMHDPRWLNQVYAYAYSTQNDPPTRKVDFAILTDFQEFLVLDCTLLAGTPQAINNFRILDWRYPDYVTRFDELWELFERNNVRDASRNRDAGLWTRYLSPKKVKANRVPPDKAFLAALDDIKTGWRVRLAKDMKKHNPALGGDVLTAAVQLWIDRLIFIKVLSDRAIEDDYLAQMAELVERDGLAENNFGWFTATRGIFQKLNQIYDGSIFASRPELEAVNVSNKVVREIIGEWLPENSPYNFASLPVEILGTIYERFLGRVVHATDKQVRIEDKPEVRKAGGVFYTPQYIVNYIVANTVGKLLAECKTPADVARLKICDPACGSGSFLLGAYDALIRWHENYYTRGGGVTPPPLTERDRDAAYYDDDGHVRLTAKFKRQILVNNLFGVDIDPQAVEVTRLSLSLKALEDTRREELYQEVDLFHQRVLPDLTNNIKCGNSLIGTDFIFTDADELKRVKPFDWRAEFPQVFDAPKPVRSLETSQVSDARGFDAVISNPPYIRIQAMKEWAPLEVEIYKEKYTAASAGNNDIYVVFVEKGQSLLNERGRLGFILPHKFFNSKYGEPLRRHIANGKHLAHVVHFGDQQVFDGATTYTALLFLDKHAHEAFDFVRVTNLDSWRAGEPQTRGEIAAANVSAAEWSFTVGENAALFERLAQMPTKLGDVCSIFVGLQTSADRVYVLEEENVEQGFVNVVDRNNVSWRLECGILKPFLNDVTVATFDTPKSRHWLIFPYAIRNGKIEIMSKMAMNDSFPNAWAYLKENMKILKSRESGKGDNPQWYGYLYRKNLTLFDEPKLVVQVISKFGRYAYDNAGIYFTGGGNGPYYGVRWAEKNSHSIFYLQALLSSRLLDWHLHRISSPFRGGYWSYGKRFIEQLPIRAIDFTNPADAARHDRMVALVERMLSLHQQRAAAQTETDQQLFQRQIDATDKQIDALVYELYGLTDDEIRIIENGA